MSIYEIREITETLQGYREIGHIGLPGAVVNFIAVEGTDVCLESKNGERHTYSIAVNGRPVGHITIAPTRGNPIIEKSPNLKLRYLRREEILSRSAIAHTAKTYKNRWSFDLEGRLWSHTKSEELKSEGQQDG